MKQKILPLLRKALKWLSILLAIFLLLATIKILLTPLPGDGLVPAGYQRVEARYLTMRDGVKIAVDIYLPEDLETTDKIPTLIRSTRYGRAFETGTGLAALLRLGILPGAIILDSDATYFNDSGYAVLLVDARGSGASFGNRPVEWSPDEIADLGEIADWIVAQPWSNGNIGSYGVSYEGNTAELAAVSGHPAIKAVAPQYSDFDPIFYIARPGGVFAEELIRVWHAGNAATDSNDICEAAKIFGIPGPCFFVKFMFARGIKQVDDDQDGSQLAAAAAEHDNIDVFSAAATAEFRDSQFGEGNYGLADFSPYGLRTQIEASDVPMYVWVSWLDAGTADGTLSRYLTFSNQQTVIIGPWSHGGGDHADPFLPNNTPTEPSFEEQREMLLAFFDAYLLDKGQPPQPGIRYYTLGAGNWQNTSAWPPEGMAPQTLYFAADGQLQSGAVEESAGADSYTVDYSATSGERTRWHTQVGGDVVYPDRASEDEKLLTYTTPPLTADMEVTGSPVVTLFVSSTHNDGAFHVYLEDVAPDGRVTYITEGVLRAIHHPVTDEQPPYFQLGPYHSFLSSDATELVPGEVTELQITLYATSVLFRRDHQIRIAIAGYDGSLFARYPAEGIPTLTVERNAIYPSEIMLPVVER